MTVPAVQVVNLAEDGGGPVVSVNTNYFNGTTVWKVWVFLRREIAAVRLAIADCRNVRAMACIGSPSALAVCGRLRRSPGLAPRADGRPAGVGRV